MMLTDVSWVDPLIIIKHNNTNSNIIKVRSKLLLVGLKLLGIASENTT